MAERPRKACFILDYCPALFDKSQIGIFEGASGAICVLYLKVLTRRNFAAEFYRENVNFIRKTASN